MTLALAPFAGLARTDWRHPEAKWIETGLKNRCAWIAPREGDVDRARELVRGFDRRGFPPASLAELDFTGTAVGLTAAKRTSPPRTSAEREGTSRVRPAGETCSS
ncbi:MAG: hypothetical protein AB1730_25250 [Myxococcota bacterium]|jgi:hypothetical protein